LTIILTITDFVLACLPWDFKDIMFFVFCFNAVVRF